ncbi:transcriptional regulator, LysR family [Solidesulfovibrio fructosivorans JJ]]|uniref:Transcriptional regulator, LysR family n=1 Tax=Solidesulfovibrio fructosivorans JJ] TaxID=596151 RepID=E1K1U0_SOLFR|nr:LysR substrate-binding domain-containing protein [Solidesulfovibrio fructosivorans]EFL49440.1 transcriptional regulator, LysR family [Solidesulfovibrio fructosivorans JJ]]
MTLRHLEIFLALAATPHMRDVAARLFVSQAAVSSALRDFEAELGVTLFDRIGRGIRLNEKGRLLESRLAPLFSQLTDIFGYVARDSMAGHVRVGASTTLADYVLPQILYDFQTRYEHVAITCESGNTADIVQHIEAGSLDIGFVEGDVRSLLVRAAPLLRERLVVVTSDRHLAAAGPQPMARLMGRRWLMREQGSGTRETFLSRLFPLDLRPELFLEFDNNDSIKAVLENPDTLACLSPLVVARELASGELFAVPIADVAFERVFSRVMHRDRIASPLLDAVSTAVNNRLQAHQSEAGGEKEEDGKRVREGDPF